jgi:methylmalonyl-CoA epimerase
MFGDTLAYVALIATDPPALADMLVRDFAFVRSEHRAGGTVKVPFLSVGKSAVAIFAPGDPYVGGEQRTGVHHIALGVPEVEAAAERAVKAGVALQTPQISKGIDGGKRALLALDATNGIRTYLVDGVERPPGRPDLIERIDHLGIVGTDNPRVVDTYCTRLGCDLQGEQFDTELQTSTEHFVYKTNSATKTIVYTRPTEFVAAVHDLFITTGDCELEVIQTLNTAQTYKASGEVAGNTRQDHGALARFLADRGPGLHHIAYKVTEIDPHLERLRAAGYRLIDQRGRPGARCSRIGFIHPKSMHGVLMHLVERPDQIEA